MQFVIKGNRFIKSLGWTQHKQRLHSRARDMGYYWPSDDVFVNVFRRIAVAVQRGNARLVFESLREKDGS